MSDELPEVRRAFEGHDAFEADGEGYRLTSTAFDGRVEAADAPEWRVAYTVTVWAPTLQSATTEEVGQAVADGWFDTLRRRLADAPKATRATVELETFDAERRDGEVVVTYGFESGTPEQAAAVAKTFVEYVEGTYVEGVIPGYDYEGVVADLVSDAASGDGQAGGTPL